MSNVHTVVTLKCEKCLGQQTISCNHLPNCWGMYFSIATGGSIATGRGHWPGGGPVWLGLSQQLWDLRSPWSLSLVLSLNEYNIFSFLFSFIIIILIFILFFNYGLCGRKNRLWSVDILHFTGQTVSLVSWFQVKALQWHFNNQWETSWWLPF